MSLLLDALKKAAEKKARKSAEQKAQAESTQVGPETTAASTTKTERLDSTQVTATQQMHTDTVVDRTEVDNTELDQTDVLNTRVDQTEVDQTEADHTGLDATDVHTTRIEATEIDSTELDSTEIEATDIPATEVDATQLDSTELDATDVNDTDYLTTTVDGTEFDDTSPSLTSDDSTMFIYPDDDNDETLQTSIDLGEQTEATDIQQALESETTPQGETLTDDDVTQFMGDGLTADEIERKAHAVGQDGAAGAEDTTITNADSLSLTNFGYEDLSLQEQEDAGYPQQDDDGRTETSVPIGPDGSIPSFDNDEGLSLDQLDDEDDVSTVMHAEQTAAATVDIEKLTNDETVTVKDSTGTRTFAPDNYDRTLLKLADSDVSKIFPGMQSDSDSVMTPDYAKKVFLSKSQSVKKPYYKIYAGLAAIVLLSVAFWGLLQVQDESEMIDNSLVRLKRDPMPGIIKPKGLGQEQSLFAQTSPQVNEKVQAIISRVEDPLAAEEVWSAESEGTNAAAQAAAQTSIAGPEAQAQEPVEPAKPQPVAGPASTTAPAESDVVVTAQPIAASADDATSRPAAANTRLTISSSSRIDEKDRVLADAYAAYENGDRQRARELYDQALALDAGNRDALLGRAAIHVQDNEFEPAIRAYQQLLEANPKDSVAMTSLLSVVNINPQAGETRIKQLLQEQPDSPYLHFALGNMYSSQQRWIEAQSAYFTALQYKPGDPNYAYNLAVSLEHMQKPGTAITFYQRALDNLATSGVANFDSQLVSQRIEVLSQ